MEFEIIRFQCCYNDVFPSAVLVIFQIIFLADVLLLPAPPHWEENQIKFYRSACSVNCKAPKMFIINKLLGSTSANSDSQPDRSCFLKLKEFRGLGGKDTDLLGLEKSLCSGTASDRLVIRKQPENANPPLRYSSLPGPITHSLHPTWGWLGADHPYFSCTSASLLSK